MATVRKPSMLAGGLRLALSRPGPVLWTYAANLGLALLFSARTAAQFSSILSHSLEAQRLTSAFDLPTVAAAAGRLTHDAPAVGSSPYFGIPLYVLLCFVLVPGTLHSYHTGDAGRLRTLLGSGTAFFWRFVRIALFTLLATLVILGPLSALSSAWTAHVDAVYTGAAAFFRQLPFTLALLLMAALLRLYFDLVECYTVLLDEQPRTGGRRGLGRGDTRVRHVLGPALRTLRGNFLRSYGTFLLLTLLGFAAFFLLSRVAIHMLAQPRVWPAFLLAQVGLLLMLFTRFWQRAAEMTLVHGYPLPVAEAPVPPAVLPETQAEPGLVSLDARPAMDAERLDPERIS